MGKLVLIALIWVVPATGSAAQQKLDWSFRSAYEHDNNIGLQYDKPQSSASTQITPDLDYSYNDGTNVFRSAGTLIFTNFNDQVYNSDDQKIDLSYSHNGEKARQTLQLNSVRDSTRSSEEEDTGVIGKQATRRVANFGNIAWQQQFSELDSSEFSGSYKKTNYESNDLADYLQKGLSINWNHLYSPRLSNNLSISYIEFDSELFKTMSATSARILTYSRISSVTATVNYQLSELWKFSFGAGVNSVDTEQNYRSRDFGFQSEEERNSDKFSATLSRHGETRNFDVSLSQDSEASASGTLRTAQKVDVKYSQAFNKKCNLISRVRYMKRKALNEKLVSFSEEEREFYSAHINLAYRLNESWWGSLGVTYKKQQLIDTDKRAEAAVASLALTYKPASTLW